MFCFTARSFMLVAVVLLAWSASCARTTAQGDCRIVARQLSYYELGNYATAEQREAYIAKKTPICEQSGVSERESDCIAQAKSRIEINACRAGLVEVSDCERAVEHVTKLFAAENRDMPFPRDEAVAQCEKQDLPKQALDCAMAATSVEVLMKCEGLR